MVRVVDAHDIGPEYPVRESDKALYLSMKNGRKRVSYTPHKDWQEKLRSENQRKNGTCFPPVIPRLRTVSSTSRNNTAAWS